MDTCYGHIFGLILQVFSSWYASWLIQCHKTVIVPRSAITPDLPLSHAQNRRHWPDLGPCLHVSLYPLLTPHWPPSNQPTESFLRPPPPSPSRTCCSKISGWEIFPRLNFSSSQPAPGHPPECINSLPSSGRMSRQQKIKRQTLSKNQTQTLFIHQTSKVTKTSMIQES